MHKFNNSIGFKDVIDYIDNESRVIRGKIPNPEGYLPPMELLHQNMRVVMGDERDILVFYMPVGMQEHDKNQYSYDTKLIAEKLIRFFGKVFPKLLLRLEMIESMPSLELREFALDYFVKSIEDSVQCTIEFSSERLLLEEEMNHILQTIQCLNATNLGMVNTLVEPVQHTLMG